MKPDHPLLAQLRAAFPATSIRAAGAFDDFGITYPDAEQYAARLDGKSWEQLDRTYFIRRSDALGFLGTSHLIAVLPVYLDAMVEDGAWSPATGMLAIILVRPLPGTDTGLGHARFDALVKAITHEQGAAVAEALRIFAEQHPDDTLCRAAREALDRHWNTYIKGTP